MAPNTFTVAIIGAGVQGLSALKNLLEASEDNEISFNPTIFESRDTIGGLWAYTHDPEIPTVLASTLGNITRYRNCYTDFPVEDDDFDQAERERQEDYGIYLGQRGMMRYLERYVEAFGLRKWIRFGTEVVSMERNYEQKKWYLRLRMRAATGSDGVVVETQQFDKVIVATGQYAVPFMPEIESIKKFGGTVLHSRAYKRGSDFAGKRVMVVGFGNTAADIATDLVGHADQVYLSHRNGNYIFPRIVAGKPLGCSLNVRKKAAIDLLGWAAPARGAKIMASMMTKLSDAAFTLRPEWRFRPPPPLATGYPIISDTLVDCLAAGRITSTIGIRLITGPHTVEMTDNSHLDVDCLIICTGYVANTALMSEVEFEVASATPDEDTESFVPLMYQNIFVPRHADSLAFLNNWKLPAGIGEVSDLMSMAIAQIWQGSFQLPSQSEMEGEIKRHREWCRLVTGVSKPPPKLVDEARWRGWLNAAAGTGVNEHLGYAVQGWLFWFRQRQLCDLLMTGLDTPFASRLFDGRRKKWEGARGAIEAANRDLDQRFGSATIKTKDQ